MTTSKWQKRASALALAVSRYLDATDAYRAKDYSNRLFDEKSWAEAAMREALLAYNMEDGR